MFFIADLGTLRTRKVEALGTRGGGRVVCREVCDVKRNAVTVLVGDAFGNRLKEREAGRM